MKEEQPYRLDSEWASIEGKLCLVTAFVPMSGRIVDGAVVALDQTTPYAEVHLRFDEGDVDKIGYITNKLDFAMLWAAFQDNALSLEGVHREPPLPACRDLSNLPHEVWVVWSRKRYCWPASWLPKIALCKLIVMVAHHGKFEQFYDMPQYAAFEPLVAWIPELKLKSKERILVRHSGGAYNVLSNVYADVVTPV